jgi:hypothetical protein
VRVAACGHPADEGRESRGVRHAAMKLR